MFVKGVVVRADSSSHVTYWRETAAQLRERARSLTSFDERDL
jgi:hypothetical protein